MNIKTFIQNDIVKTALWVGISAAISAVGAFILDKPELAEYYGIVNIILYAIKATNDKRKK